MDTDGCNEIASFQIHCILFCARGRPETPEKECFAFACSHGETAETSIFHCHIFKCDSPETVSLFWSYHFFISSISYKYVPKKLVTAQIRKYYSKIFILLLKITFITFLSTYLNIFTLNLSKKVWFLLKFINIIRDN